MTLLTILSESGQQRRGRLQTEPHHHLGSLLDGQMHWVFKEGKKVGLSWDEAVAWNVFHHYSQLSLLISSDSSALRK